MTSFEDSYQAAYESGLLPGVSLAATNKDGIVQIKTLNERS